MVHSLYHDEEQLYSTHILLLPQAAPFSEKWEGSIIVLSPPPLNVSNVSPGKEQNQGRKTLTREVYNFENSNRNLPAPNDWCGWGLLFSSSIDQKALLLHCSLGLCHAGAAAVSLPDIDDCSHDSSKDE